MRGGNEGEQERMGIRRTEKRGGEKGRRDGVMQRGR
jgi:hypothetical protein